MTERVFITADLNTNTSLSLNGILSGLCPVGAIVMLPVITIPEGFVECNGTALNINEYPDLFDKIGYTYGNPGGNQFNVPSLQACFVRGRDDMNSAELARGVDTVRDLGNVQSQTYGSHNHTANINVNSSGNHTHTFNKIEAKQYTGGSDTSNGDHGENHPFSFAYSTGGSFSGRIFRPYNYNSNTKHYTDGEGDWDDTDPPGTKDNDGRGGSHDHEKNTSLSGGSHGHSHNFSTNNAGTGGTYGTKPRNVALLWLIKY